jgi:hypothetical protein
MGAEDTVPIHQRHPPKELWLEKIERIKEQDRVLRAGIMTQCSGCGILIRRSDAVCFRCGRPQASLRLVRASVRALTVAGILALLSLSLWLAYVGNQAQQERRDAELRNRQEQQESRRKTPQPSDSQVWLRTK